MNIQINIPTEKPNAKAPRRVTSARRIYFQPDTGLRAYLTVPAAGASLIPPADFRTPDFRVRCTQIALVMVLAAAWLPLSSTAQSLWREDTSRPMFADKRAMAVGDILTVAVQENTTSSKDNKLSTSKSTAVDASVSTFFYTPAVSKLLTKGGELPAMKFQSANDYSGGGKINNSENIIARVSVRVIDVLPNRNLVIEGKRETAFSGERQTVILRGIVRPEDVTANNTVFSYNISDATIQIISKGTITDNQRKGWFNRIWDKLSPF